MLNLYKLNSVCLLQLQLEIKKLYLVACTLESFSNNYEIFYYLKISKALMRLYKAHSYIELSFFLITVKVKRESKFYSVISVLTCLAAAIKKRELIRNAKIISKKNYLISNKSVPSSNFLLRTITTVTCVTKSIRRISTLNLSLIDKRLIV